MGTQDGAWRMHSRRLSSDIFGRLFEYEDGLSFMYAESRGDFFCIGGLSVFDIEHIDHHG